MIPTPGQIARWTLGADCSLPCPLLPINDECSGAILITSGPIYTGSTLHATTDGPGMGCEQNCGGLCNTAPDVWYKWVSKPTQSQTTFDMTYPIHGYDGIGGDTVNYPRSLYTYDSMMLVYSGCPANGGTQVPGACNDAYFNSASRVSEIILSSQSINPNTTYWIRISGWAGSSGNFTLRVNQP